MRHKGSIPKKLKKYINDSSFFVPIFILLFFTGCASSSKSESWEVRAEEKDSSGSYIKLAPFVTEEMLTSDYWLNSIKNPEKVLMSPKQIALWNEQIEDTTISENDNFYIYKDLRAYGNVTTALEICRSIISYNPGSPWYKKIQNKKGETIHTLNDRDFKIFWTEMNLEPLVSWKSWINQRWIPLEVKDVFVTVKKAVTVRRTNIRQVPQDTFYSDDKDYWYDDIAQNSGILMNEPVLVLWESADKKWFYVQTAFCPGWIKAEDIAFCSDLQFEKYFDFAKRVAEGKNDFITVTAERFQLSKDYSSGEFDIPELFMGTYLKLVDWDVLKEKRLSFRGRIPFASYLVEIPYKKADGTLGIHLGAVPAGICCKGLLPYTKKNVLELAFAPLGQRYGWGGMNDFRDCSEYLKDIYRCFGFNFPRNSRSQLAMPGETIDFDEKSVSEKKSALNDIEAPAVMGFAGHVFLYLGKVDSKYYAVSALGSYHPDDVFEERIDANSVNVNTLDVKRKSGKSWIEVLSAAKLLSEDKEFEERKIALDDKWEFADFSKIHSGKAVLYKAKKDRKNITVAVNAGHGTKGGTKTKTYSHPDKTPKITDGTNPLGAVESFSISDGMIFVNGEKEAEINLRVARLVRDKLLLKGFDVLMIRDGDDVQLDNIARTVIANNNAHLHVSIHFDSDSSKKDKGCFYCSIPEGLERFKNVKKHRLESEKLGQCFVEAVKELELPLYNNGKMQADLTQTVYSTIPTADFELGNQYTALTPQNLEIRSQAVAQAIINFIER